MTTLNKSKVVIAGGSSGIGAALAKILTEDGADITVIGRDPGKLDLLKTALPSIETVALDACNRTAVGAFFHGMREIDHLVLTLSGSKGGGMFKDLSLDELRDHRGQQPAPAHLGQALGRHRAAARRRPLPVPGRL